MGPAWEAEVRSCPLQEPQPRRCPRPQPRSSKAPLLLPPQAEEAPLSGRWAPWSFCRPMSLSAWPASRAASRTPAGFMNLANTFRGLPGAWRCSWEPPSAYPPPRAPQSWSPAGGPASLGRRSGRVAHVWAVCSVQRELGAWGYRLAALQGAPGVGRHRGPGLRTQSAWELQQQGGARRPG